MSRNRMDADQQGLALTREIDSLTKQLGEIHEAHKQNLTDLSKAIGDSWQGSNTLTEGIIRRIAILNKDTKLITARRKQLREQRSRLRNQFVFREEEVQRMMEIIGRELDENPLDTMLHEIFSELDTITIQEESNE